VKFSVTLEQSKSDLDCQIKVKISKLIHENPLNFTFKALTKAKLPLISPKVDQNRFLVCGYITAQKTGLNNYLPPPLYTPIKIWLYVLVGS
jgi:hypothetical protein